MSSDGPAAAWEHVAVPDDGDGAGADAGTGRPALVRAVAPVSLADASPAALVDDVTIGLGEWFSDVLAIDVRADPPDAGTGSIRLVHAAVDRNGEGVTIETLLRRTGEMTCWVAPTPRYLMELPVARRASAGRPTRPATRAAASEGDEPRGVPVAEAWLRVSPARDRASNEWAVFRRGPLAQAIGPDGAPPRPLAGSAVPVWLFAALDCGPRPASADRTLSLTSRRELECRLALPGPKAGGLGELVHGLRRRWWLEWAYGQDDALEPADDDWSTARILRQGRLEVLDGGRDGGLWRVLTDLPDVLAEELADPGHPADGQDDVVALVPVSAEDIWRELMALVTD